MIELSRIAKSYKTAEADITVLKSVDVRLMPGDLATITGPSGCGKTTLLLIAGGLLKPDSGDVRIDGLSLYNLSPDRRARMRSALFGYVYQQFHLMPYLDVLENVLVPTIVSGEDRMEQAMQLITDLRLDGRLHHKPAALSIGERQRTALARALILSPQILLADEPTGNLDDVNSEIVLKHFEAFAERGGTVLVVSHEKSIAERSTRRFALKGGALREE